MKDISLKELLEAGCHFGHQTTRWNPKMKTYIFTARDNIHIFDLVKTKEGLEEAVLFLKKISGEGGKILLVGTKRQSQDIIKAAALKVNMPYITVRWIGGLLTNWNEVKKRVEQLADLKAGKAEGRFKERTKRENLLIDREIAKLERNFGGVADLTGLPSAVFVADARKDDLALREAKRAKVSSVAIVDTNSDPDLADFVIPANDDAVKSIELIVSYVVEAIEEGKTGGSSKKKKEEKEVKAEGEDKPVEKKAVKEVKTKKKAKK